MVPSVLWSAPVPPAIKHDPQHEAATPCFTVGMVFGMWPLSPCAVANCSLAFLWRSWSSGFFLAEQPFRLCWDTTRFTVEMDIFVPVPSSIFKCCVVLGLIHTFCSKARSSLGDRKFLPSRAVWQLPGPTVFILMCYCWYRWTWCIQAFGYCCQGWTRIVEVQNSFWLISLDFSMMSHKEALSLKVGLQMTQCQKCWLAYQKFLKPWHHFLEFSKVFKGTVNLVYVNFWPNGIVI